MDSELAKEIKEAVLEVLNNSDMDSTTEFQVRKSASDLIGIDLNEPSRKKFVRNIVQTYLEERQAKADADDNNNTNNNNNNEEEEEAEPEEESEDDDNNNNNNNNNNNKTKGAQEFDDEGDLIICRLSDKRRVTLTEFRGKSLVSIREYYKRDGKELPSSKGISLTPEQWANFSKNVPAIEKAIKKLEGRMN
ncbi:RNA polymerase II transcriptional coactivator KELP-like [Bidens hawaiensis]|uniref:RNA polymerase II transcriptional coactivator KELP-like n=1 Tax=Bidens hawaiensis TaxID=980011 RepID=UPI00404A5763